MRALVAVILLFSVVPLVALDLGPERPVSSVVYEPAPESRQRPRVALNDSGGLVFWSDARNEFLSAYFARLDRDGKLLDPTGRRITIQAEALDVIWTGSAWFVVYRELDNQRRLVGRTIAMDGSVGPVKEIPRANQIFRSLRMATNGSSIAVVTDMGMGAVLELDGSVRSTFDWTRAFPPFDYTVDIAAVGDTYGIVAVVEDGVEFRSLSASGTLSSPALLPESPLALTAALGSDGSSFLAVYDTPPHLYAQKLDGLGTPVDAPRRVVTLDIRLEPMFPSIAWGGSDYLVSLSRIDSNTDSQPMAMRLTRDGAVAAPAIQTLHTSRTFNGRTDVARRGDGSAVLVAVSGNDVLEAAIFDGSAVLPRTVRPLSFSAPSQRRVRMAGEGNTLITAWEETTALASEIRLASGVGGTTIVVASQRWVELRDVAVDGSDIWVVWFEADGVQTPRLRAQRYDASLRPAAAEPVTLFTSPGPDALQAAAGGGALLVTWASSYRPAGVIGRVVRPDGTVAPVEVKTPYNAPHSAAAWNGSEFVLTWSQATQPVFYEWREPVPYVVQAVRVTTDGVVRDAAPLMVSDVPNVAHWGLRAAPSNGSVVIAWQEAPLESAFFVTKIVRFTGAERPPARILDPPSQRALMAMAALGERIALLWLGRGLEYAILDRQFALEDSGSLPVYATSADIAARAGQPVIGYSREVEEPELGGVPRVFLRVPGLIRRRATR